MYDNVFLLPRWNLVIGNHGNLIHIVLGYYGTL